MGLLITIVLSVGVILFVFMIYSLDHANPLKKKTEIVNKLIDLFKAEPVAKDVMRFTMKTIDFYVEIRIDFRQAFQLANVEIINFHIPKDQFDRLSRKPEIPGREHKLNGIQTYFVYQTNGNGLKRAKEELDELIDEINPAS